LNTCIVMKRVEFVFETEELVFGNYDIMYPQTTDKKTIRSSFDGDAKLKTYFGHYIQWLLEVGFSKEEIHQQMNRYCNFQDEISAPIRQTKAKGLLLDPESDVL